MDHLLFNSPNYGGEVARLAGSQLPIQGSSICRVRYGKLLGGVVYYNNTEESVCAHIAGTDEHWLNRDMLWVMFDYPFNQLGVNRIFGMVAANNEHALKFNRKLGFREVAWVEGLYKGNVTCVVMRMDREDCRFLKLTPKSIKSNYH